MVARYLYSEVAEVTKKGPEITGRAFGPARSAAVCFGYGCRRWGDDFHPVWYHAIAIRIVVVVGRVTDYGVEVREARIFYGEGARTRLTSDDGHWRIDGRSGRGL
jgi:hypothetical protein